MGGLMWRTGMVCFGPFALLAASVGCVEKGATPPAWPTRTARRARVARMHSARVPGGLCSTSIDGLLGGAQGCGVHQRRGLSKRDDVPVGRLRGRSGAHVG